MSDASPTPGGDPADHPADHPAVDRAPGAARVIANLGRRLVVRDEPAGPARSGSTDAAATERQVVPLRQLPLVVAGDLVRVQTDAAGAERAVELVTRTSVLERPGEHGHRKALAANLTHLVIVSAAPPGIDTLLIDQFCVGAQRAGLEAVVVVNKADLLDATRRARADVMLEAYRAAGHPGIACDASSPGGLDPLGAELAGRVSALVGASGVGKSSIVAALLPDRDVRIGALSASSELGSHTTSVTCWYALPGGGAIVDSPGVRQYAVETLERDDVRAGYREIRALAEACRFNDCLHVVEPGCAVRGALDAGALAAFRYANYRRLAGV